MQYIVVFINNYQITKLIPIKLLVMDNIIRSNRASAMPKSKVNHSNFDNSDKSDFSDVNANYQETERNELLDEPVNASENESPLGSTYLLPSTC